MTCPAILFLVFNRPDVTRRSFDAIRRARPARLYVAADGPREGHDADPERCAEARRIATAVDWPCDCLTLFRRTNLGCRLGVSEAIDWFFENEEEGIILEDDCVPSSSFFPFCAALLERHRGDGQVMSICGNSPLGTRPHTSATYFYSRFPSFWGWATWRRAWSLYDRNLSAWPAFRDAGQLAVIDPTPKFARYWREKLDQTAMGKIDSWGYRWLFSCWLNDGLSAQSFVNLVSNIGFGDDATHTSSRFHSQSNERRGDIAFPLRAPARLEPNRHADRLIQYRQLSKLRPQNFLNRFRNRFIRLLR